MKHYTLERVAAITGVPAADIARLAGEFATNRPAVAVLPTEPGGLDSGNGLYTALAIHALNALVGSIDAAGGVHGAALPEPRRLARLHCSMRSGGQANLAQDAPASVRLPLARSGYQNLPERHPGRPALPAQRRSSC